ncbi:MAG: hypothetical protein WCP77_07390 [Roseococcus sp.]
MFKRYCAAVNTRPDAISVLQRPDDWFEEYNTIPPHSGLRFQSPRELIQQQLDRVLERRRLSIPGNLTPKALRDSLCGERPCALAAA